MDIGRHLAMLNSQDSLNQTGDTSGTLRVANVGFDLKE
jgi:hypothetical protein